MVNTSYNISSLDGSVHGQRQLIGLRLQENEVLFVLSVSVDRLRWVGKGDSNMQLSIWLRLATLNHTEFSVDP